MGQVSEITFTTPALHVELNGTTWQITREGKGGHLELDRTQLIRNHWAPLTGPSLPGQVVVRWRWSDDTAEAVDKRGRVIEYGTLSEVVEELAFLYLS